MKGGHVAICVVNFEVRGPNGMDYIAAFTLLYLSWGHTVLLYIGEEGLFRVRQLRGRGISDL